jgi:HK97 family phage prohead protease
MLHKSFEILETKADGDSGIFEALVSVFNNVDSDGDRILPGAYTKTLERWRESGDPIPIILSHQWTNPFAHIGVAYPKDVKQTPRGLMVKGRLDIKDNDVARQVYRLMQRRSLKEFSIGYKVPAGGEHRAEDGANDITEIDLVEAGPTLKGANGATELHAVKSALEATDEPASEVTLRKASDHADRDLTPLPPTDAAAVKARTEQAEQALLALEHFEPDEIKGIHDGVLKAVWTTAFINDLPDSSFLHIESGGSKDADGKTTPRSLRHFPYKDTAGNVDMPHLRNALSRIPQSSLLPDVKERLAARARRILDNQKSEPSGADEAPTKVRSADPLRQRSLQAVLDIQSDGVSTRKPPKAKQEPKPKPASEADLRRRSREAMLALLTGEHS